MAKKSLCLPLRENGTIYVDIRFHTGRKCPGRCNISDSVQEFGSSNLLDLARRILALLGSTTKVDGKDENLASVPAQPEQDRQQAHQLAHRAPKRPICRRFPGNNALGNRTEQNPAVQSEDKSCPVLKVSIFAQLSRSIVTSMSIQKTYNGISVYEMKVNGTRVMRRCNDSWMNASQILTLAGLPKKYRLKQLTKEVHSLEHERIQGGRAQYQGTWIALDNARKLCRKHNVGHLLRPLLEPGTNGIEGNRISVGPVRTSPADSRPRSSTTEQVMATLPFTSRGDLDLATGTADRRHHCEQGLLLESSNTDSIRGGQLNYSRPKAPAESIRLLVQVFDLVSTSDSTKRADFPFESEFPGTETEAGVYNSLSSSTLDGINALPESNHQQKLRNARLRVYLHMQGSSRRELHENGTEPLFSLLPERSNGKHVSFFVELKEK